MRLTVERRVGNLRRHSPAHLVGLTQRFLQAGGPFENCTSLRTERLQEGRPCEQQRSCLTRSRVRNSALIRTFNQSAIGTALIELNGNWIRVNPAFCQILGYSE